MRLFSARPLFVILAMLTVVGVGVVHGGSPASAGEGDEVYPMIFPVVGENRYSDTFGACRGSGCSRGHEGVDIIAAKMTPVVAVADGTVRWIRNGIGTDCCYMALAHDDGWESWYIHLNNDTMLPDGTVTDDGLGYGFVEGLESGSRVFAGQLIGWVGDSGNAEWTVSHLHFELHKPDGTVINPTPSADAAARIPAPYDEPGTFENACPEGSTCDTVAFVDAGARFDVRSAVQFGAESNRFFFGNPGDVPLMGDWDGDGVPTPAMYRPSNGFMYLRNSNTQGVGETEFFYGDPSDIPIAGDWDGDGDDSLAIYRQSEGRVYIKDTLGTGVADYSFYFGNPGDVPFVGDFDGDGRDTIGLYRVTTGFVYFRNSNDSGAAEFEFYYGEPGDVILAGDWDGDGVDSVAVYRASNGMLYLKNSNTQGVADFEIQVGSYIAARKGPKTTTSLPEG